MVFGIHTPITLFSARRNDKPPQDSEWGKRLSEGPQEQGSKEQGWPSLGTSTTLLPAKIPGSQVWNAVLSRNCFVQLDDAEREQPKKGASVLQILGERRKPARWFISHGVSGGKVGQRGGKSPHCPGHRTSRGERKQSADHLKKKQAKGQGGHHGEWGFFPLKGNPKAPVSIQNFLLKLKPIIELTTGKNERTRKKREKSGGRKTAEGLGGGKKGKSVLEKNNQAPRKEGDIQVWLSECSRGQGIPLQTQSSQQKKLQTADEKNAAERGVVFTVRPNSWRTTRDKGPRRGKKSPHVV